MKRVSFLILVLALTGFGVSVANATPINLVEGDSYYVGFISDGVPASASDDLSYITNLITLAPGAGATVLGSETYSRIDSTLTVLPLSGSITRLGASLNGNGGNSYEIIVTGPTYITAKYDAHNAGEWVWLVEAGTYYIPAYDPEKNKYGLSNVDIISASSSSTSSVPEPTTLLLLGAGLVGFAAFRRKSAAS